MFSLIPFELAEADVPQLNLVFSALRHLRVRRKDVRVVSTRHLDLVSPSVALLTASQPDPREIALTDNIPTEMMKMMCPANCCARFLVLLASARLVLASSGFDYSCPVRGTRRTRDHLREFFASRGHRPRRAARPVPAGGTGPPVPPGVSELLRRFYELTRIISKKITTCLTSTGTSWSRQVVT